jgi:hypothetical protein
MGDAVALEHLVEDAAKLCAPVAVYLGRLAPRLAL